MLRTSTYLLAAAFALSGIPALAQTPPPATTPPAAPAANPVAATVNGHPIPETAVQRGLRRVPPAKRAEARTEILNYLIDNILIEQYLQQLQVVIDPKDVEKKFEEIRTELKKKDKDWDVWLKTMELTEAELKLHISADLRWDKYAVGVANEKVLRELFDGNKDRFDGSQVEARHILLAPDAKDPKAVEAAKAELLGYKKQIEAKVAEGLAKLPATSDALAREKARQELQEKAFDAIAREKSACPSKADGGDLGFFSRAGDMVEAFSKTAFALQPHQMSDVVQTPFGYHLILTTARKPGRDVKFEDVKDDVREVYCDKLREAMAAQARQKSKIEVAPVAKP